MSIRPTGRPCESTIGNSLIRLCDIIAIASCSKVSDVAVVGWTDIRSPIGSKAASRAFEFASTRRQVPWSSTHFIFRSRPSDQARISFLRANTFVLSS